MLVYVGCARLVLVVGGRLVVQEHTLLYGILYIDHSGLWTRRCCYQQIAQSNWNGGFGSTQWQSVLSAWLTC